MIVTIVTPTLNAVDFLKECIESARRNATRGIEIEHVIVDGGSTDGTVELARSYVEGGFDHIHLHQIGPDQDGFFEFWSQELRPRLRELQAAAAR